MNVVEVSCADVDCPGPALLWEGFCERVLNTLSLDNRELSVLFCDDVRIRELNRTYRGLDEPTDVLSFSQEEGPREEGLQEPIRQVPGAVRMLGDVVISVQTAAKAAERHGERPERELRRLLIHGILHLTGMDHTEGDNEMIRLQENLLDRLEEEGLS